MKRTEEELQRISDYLHRKLSVDEAAAFEAEIATDGRLAEDVSKLQLLQQVASRQQLRDEIQLIQTQKLTAWLDEENMVSSTKVIGFPHARSSSSFRRFSGLASAASVVLLMGYLSLSEVSYESVSAVPERSNIPSTPDPILQKLDEGITLLKNDHPNEAFEVFEQVEASQNTRAYYRHAATWYEVVALQKAGKTSEAKTLLNNIESSSDFQYEISTLDKWKIKWKLLF